MASSDPPINPYPGLRPFEADEDYLFFGREGQADALLRRLGKSRFVAVVGTSGCGKSSLVKAGLLPALHGGFMAGAGSGWRIALFRPGRNPVREMALALNAPGVLGSDQADAPDAAIQAGIFEAALRRSSRGLVETVRQARLGPHENLLLVVDQFEELFRFHAGPGKQKNSDEAAAFVKLILKAVKTRHPPIYVVITMRSDFLGDCTRFRNLPETINDSQYLIPRMTRDQRRLAIEGPASVRGVCLAPRLVQHLLNDVGDNPDQLPILQHALMRTWACWQAGGDDTPDLEHYEVAGRLEKALSQHADEVYAELPHTADRLIAEKLFKCITEKGADNRGIRRPESLADLCHMIGTGEAEVVSVIEAFRRPGRSFLAPPAEVPLTSESMVDISHESLMRIWHRLEAWVDEEAESARTYRRLAETAELHRKKKAGLLRDPALQLALDWREENQPTNTWATRYHPGFETAMNFLEESRTARDTEIARVEQERQRELEQAKALAEERLQRLAVQDAAARRQKKMTLAVSFCLVIAIALGVLALKERSEAMMARQTAEKHQRISRSRELAAFAAMTLETDPTLSFRLAEAAFNAQQTALAEKNLFPPLEHLLYNSLEGHKGKVTSAAFSPDGKRAITASDDRTARIWNVTESRVIKVLEGHTKGVTGACFSPDGRLVVTASRDGTVQIRDAQSGQLLRTLKYNGADVTSVSFSRDGKQIVTASRDNIVRIWDPADGRMLRPPIKMPGDAENDAEDDYYGFNSASFSPDGKQVVTASEDDTVRIWDTADGRQVRVLGKHLQCVNTAVFSPDGNQIVTASDDNTARVWNTETGYSKALKGHTDDVVNAVFSGDGAYVVTASKDNTVRIWDWAEAKELHLLAGHSKGVNSAAFSADNKWIITASDDGTARTWRLETPHLLTGQSTTAPFSPQGKYILTASRKDDTVRIWGIKGGKAIHTFQDQSIGCYADRIFSADGSRLVTNFGNRAFIWDVEQGKELSRLEGHTSCVTSAEFSRDGTRVVTASGDRTARIWDAMTGRMLFTLAGHENEVTSATFSADGQRVVTASMDLSVRIWNAKTGDELNDAHRIEVSNAWDAVNAALSPDGRFIATIALGDIPRIWDAVNGTELYKLKVHNEIVSRGMFSPDGKRIIIAAGNTARILDAKTGHERLALRGHAQIIQYAVFSPDGKRIITTSEDGTTRIWDADHGKERYKFRGQEETLLTAAFSPDGKRVVIASNDNTTRICITDPEQVLNAVNEDKVWGVVRNLTPAEKKKYGFAGQ